MDGTRKRVAFICGLIAAITVSIANANAAASAIQPSPDAIAVVLMREISVSAVGGGSYDVTLKVAGIISQPKRGPTIDKDGTIVVTTMQNSESRLPFSPAVSPNDLEICLVKVAPGHLVRISWLDVRLNDANAELPKFLANEKADSALVGKLNAMASDKEKAMNFGKVAHQLSAPTGVLLLIAERLLKCGLGDDALLSLSDGLLSLTQRSPYYLLQEELDLLGSVNFEEDRIQKSQNVRTASALMDLFHARVKDVAEGADSDEILLTNIVYVWLRQDSVLPALTEKCRSLSSDIELLERKISSPKAAYKLRRVRALAATLDKMLNGPSTRRD